MTRIRLLLVVLLGAAALSGAAAEPIRVEGEAASASDVKRHPWYDKVDADQFGGGDFISHFSADGPGTARYDVTVEQAGAYHLWVRANPTRCTLEVRIGEGAWRRIVGDDRSDPVNVAADGKLDLRFLAWINAGQVDLAKGANHISFRFGKDDVKQHHGYLDAFLLSKEPIKPAGRDGQAAADVVADDGDDTTYAFDPPPDADSAQALLNLRTLNEAVAGQDGFVRLSPDRQGFVLGSGEPARFWAVNGYVFRKPPEATEAHARFLARRGVNMVRLHLDIPQLKNTQHIEQIDTDLLDRVHRYIAALKGQGIYVTICPYFPLAKAPEAWALPGVLSDGTAPAVIYTEPKLRDAYKAWVKAFYAAPNPYLDGVAIKDEPAVAVIQVLNEDSLFFWTADKLPETQMRNLEQAFGKAMIERYGSIAETRKAWGDASHPRDDFDAGRVGLHDLWQLTNNKAPGKQTRLADETRFRAEYQRAFYDEMMTHLREGVGVKQLLNATNWKTADTRRLGDIERWTYTTGEVCAVNTYFNGLHRGDNSGWRIEPGHLFTHRSALHEPWRLPVNFKQTAGQPIIATETLWVPPSRYAAEGPLLAAAYTALTGVDAACWFASSEPGWNHDPKFPWQKVDGQHPHTKFHVNFPQTLGQFPANALMFRKGYVAAGQPAVVERRTLEQMWQREPAAIAEGQSYDPNRDAALPGEQAKGSAANQLAFLVGPVLGEYGLAKPSLHVAPLDAFIDARAKVVRSNTGELTLDYGRGVFTLDAPKAQAVAGFLKDAGGRFGTRDVVFICANEYAVLQVVAVDDRPLRESRRVLVQVGAPAHPTGWRTEPATFTVDKRQVVGERIVSVGTGPWQVQKIDARLTLDNPRINKAIALDANFVPRFEVGIEHTESFAMLKLPPDAAYILLTD